MNNRHVAQGEARIDAAVSSVLIGWEPHAPVWRHRNKYFKQQRPVSGHVDTAVSLSNDSQVGTVLEMFLMINVV